MGFDERVLHYHWDHTYDNEGKFNVSDILKRDRFGGNWNNMQTRVSVPTYDHAFAYLRDNHHLFYSIMPYNGATDKEFFYIVKIEKNDNDGGDSKYYRSVLYDNLGPIHDYNTARLLCLKRLIEIANAS